MTPGALPRLRRPPADMASLDRRRWTGGLAFVSHGARLGVRVDDARVLARLPAYLPPGHRPARGPVVDDLYSLVVGRGARRPAELYSGTERLVRSADLVEVLETLEHALHFNVAVRARRKLFVHAGVVGWQGGAIVIPGRTFSGKSSLVEALLRGGATYYSDEYAVLDERGRVHPYAKRLSLRGRAGERARKVSAESMGARSGTVPLPVATIVVSRYEAGARWRPRRLSPGETLLALLDNTVLARSRPVLAMRTLGQVAPHAVALKGRRGEAEDVVRQLLR